MCGIFGYIGNREIVPVLIGGLKKLEYRGYDSAGICVSKNGTLQYIKKEGRISELEKEEGLKKISGSIGIAHTRWATHGKPNEKNSHPHLDCKKEIAIVHNGIIENYRVLKKLLTDEGHKILSETDSEIIVHLIEKFYEGDLEDALSKTLKLIEGAYGIAVLSSKEEKIIVAKKGSPLVIGVGEKEMFVASDISPIVEYTKKVIYLSDDEIGIISRGKYIIKNRDGKQIEKDLQEIKWSIESIEKANFKHFMLKESFEEPEVIKNTIRGRIKEGKIKLSINLDFKKIKRIILTACGTSWHSALIGKYLIEEYSKIPCEVDYASEFRYRNPLISEGDLIIAISQSGETADTLAAIKEAKERGAKTLGIVNVVGSTISREVDSGIYLHAGPETGVASTKAFVSQVIAILLFSIYLKQEKGEEIDKELLLEIENIPDKIEKVLFNSEKIKKIAEKFKDSKNFLYFGRGINFPVALEGALKLKEISYIHAEGYPAAEMKHGPIALIDKNMPVVFLATKSSISKKILSNIEEVYARKGKIISIVNEKDLEIEKFSEEVIVVPETLEELSPVVNVISLQLLAYHIANLRGFDVDKPRNLAKSVTVE
ncbi:MAG: glutamine--fructose-6-phosphate transaminase (isomerizing) [Nanoarchaeota archaeon]|nr:glutamine--fructose-6-phosphate transaminase (isomerizing) [Nanoarchaeota archaeon]